MRGPRSRAFIAALALAFFILFACKKAPPKFPPPPTGADIVTWLAPDVATGSHNLMRLVDATVKSATVYEKQGMRSLDVRFSYRVEFTADCRYFKYALKGGSPIFDAAALPPETPMDGAKKGEIAEFELRVYYLPGPNGWVHFPGSVSLNDEPSSEFQRTPLL